MAILFPTCPFPVQFADQYLSIGTSLPKGYNLYGLGEHVTPYFRLQPRTITMWNFDTATPEYNNLCEWLINFFFQ